MKYIFPTLMTLTNTAMAIVAIFVVPAEATTSIICMNVWMAALYLAIIKGTKGNG